VSGSVPLAALLAPHFPPGWIAAAGLLNGGLLAGVRLRRFFWQRKVWAGLGGAALVVAAFLLVRPDGQVHVYALDVGTGSAVLIRTGGGQQILIDGGPDPDRFAQAIGRALPPTARTIKVWVITSGRRTEIGAGGAVLTRFHVERIVVADPDPWTPTLRALIQKARQSGAHVETNGRSVELDAVRLSLLGDEQSWLVQSGSALLAVIPPDGSWHGYPQPVPTAIFTRGGPTEWPPITGAGLAVIQVAANSRDGLPAHAFSQAINASSVLRTDRLGSVELVARASRWEPALTKGT